MLETARALEWIYTLLHGDSTLQGLAPGGVWHGLAPVGTVAPWVIAQHQAGTDVMVNSAYRVLVRDQFLVKIVGPTSGYANLVAAADRVDTLLHNSKGTVTDATILEVVRIAPLAIDELVDGVLYSNLGGEYRVWTRAGV